MEPNPITTDIDERIAIALGVQNDIRQKCSPLSELDKERLKIADPKDYEFNLMQLGFFLFADMEYLRNMRRVITTGQVFDLLRASQTVESFLGICRPRLPFLLLDAIVLLTIPVLHHGLEIQPAENLDTYDEEEDDRSERAKRMVCIERVYFAISRDKNANRIVDSQTKTRDGERCVMTGTAFPEAAHIWPFTVNNTAENYGNSQECFRNLFPFLGQVQALEMQSLFTPESGQLASSDEPWNMVSFGRSPHDWWSRGLFGLKWLGANPDGQETSTDARGRPIYYTRYRIQFFWLPNEISQSFRQYLSPDGHKRCRQKVRLDDESTPAIAGQIKQSLEAPFPFSQDKRVRLRDENGRLIQSGRVFEFKVETRDLEKTEKCIRWQWLAIRIAAFSAAGESRYDLDRQCPPPQLSLVMGIGPGLTHRYARIGRHGERNF